MSALDDLLNIFDKRKRFYTELTATIALARKNEKESWHLLAAKFSLQPDRIVITNRHLTPNFIVITRRINPEDYPIIIRSLYEKNVLELDAAIPIQVGGLHPAALFRNTYLEKSRLLQRSAFLNENKTKIPIAAAVFESKTQPPDINLDGLEEELKACTVPFASWREAITELVFDSANVNIQETRIMHLLAAPATIMRGRLDGRHLNLEVDVYEAAKAKLRLGAILHTENGVKREQIDLSILDVHRVGKPFVGIAFEKELSEVTYSVKFYLSLEGKLLDEYEVVNKSEFASLHANAHTHYDQGFAKLIDALSGKNSEQFELGVGTLFHLLDFHTEWIGHRTFAQRFSLPDWLAFSFPYLVVVECVTKEPELRDFEKVASFAKDLQTVTKLQCIPALFCPPAGELARKMAKVDGVALVGRKEQQELINIAISAHRARSVKALELLVNLQ